MKYEKQTFDGVDIVLDGNEYWNCTFNKCRVIFRGLQGHTLANPTFNGCAWHFDGPAGNTLAFLSAVYGSGADGKRLIETVRRRFAKVTRPRPFTDDARPLVSAAQEHTHVAARSKATKLVAFVRSQYADRRGAPFS